MLQLSQKSGHQICRHLNDLDHQTAVASAASRALALATPPTDVATSDWGGRQHEINMKIMETNNSSTPKFTETHSQRARRAHANKSTNHQQKKEKTQIFRGTLGNEIKGDPPNTSDAAPACFQDPQYKGGKPAKYRGKMATFSPCGNHLPTYKSYKSAQVPF